MTVSAVEEFSAAAATSYWIDQSSAAMQDLTASGLATAAATWAAFGAWYDPAAVFAVAADLAQFSASAQQAATGLFAEYVGQTVAAIRGDARIEIPRVEPRPIRNDADPVTVHARPAEVYRRDFSLFGDEDQAIERAIQRSMQLIETDIRLAARQAQQDAMEELRITEYRRILRPELSEDGPCGLCVVAADRIYKVKDLLPIHGRCKCQTVAIAPGPGGDPGLNLNRRDLKRIYAAAGNSTDGADLKRVRVRVNQHGELGPVLSVRGQKFTGPDDLDDLRPAGEAAKRQYDQLIGVMGDLMNRQKSGERLDGAIAYQQRQLDRLSA